jgi:hypothetical protein
MFHTPPFWSDSPRPSTEELPATGLPPPTPSTTFLADYTPTDQQTVDHRYVSPSCLLFLLVHLVLVSCMVVLHPTNILLLSPFLAVIPLVGTIYIFNSKVLRKWKVSHMYWFCVQMAGECFPSGAARLTTPSPPVILTYASLMLLSLIGPHPSLQSTSSFDEESLEKLTSLSVGQYKLSGLSPALSAASSDPALGVKSFASSPSHRSCRRLCHSQPFPTIRSSRPP